MKAHRKIGLTVGILFIVGTLSGIMSFFLTGAINGSNEYLVNIASNSNQFMVGSLFVLLMGFSVAFIPIVLYPVLSKYDKALAIGYVVFRGAIETVTYIAIWISMLLVVFTSKTYTFSKDVNSQEVQNSVSILVKCWELSSLSTIFVFGIGALLFYIALYRSKLIPTWLSLWGTVAILLHIITGFLIMFDIAADGSALNSYLNFPIFLQEMVMAVWLMVKGFDEDFFNKLKQTPKVLDKDTILDPAVS